MLSKVYQQTVTDMDIIPNGILGILSSLLCTLIHTPTCFYIHRVPKLATPLASNTHNAVWSSWISMKYRTLHYLNITYCHTYYDVRTLPTLPCMLSVTSLWHQSLQTVWDELDQCIIDKVVKQYPPKSLHRCQRWPLWAQTLMTSSEWSSPWMFHIL